MQEIEKQPKSNKTKCVCPATGTNDRTHAQATICPFRSAHQHQQCYSFTWQTRNAHAADSRQPHMNCWHWIACVRHGGRLHQTKCVVVLERQLPITIWLSEWVFVSFVHEATFRQRQIAGHDLGQRRKQIPICSRISIAAANFRAPKEKTRNTSYRRNNLICQRLLSHLQYFVCTTNTKWKELHGV